MLVNGVNYDVKVAGSGEAVLLLHGFTGSNKAWDDLFERNVDFKLVAPSLIGHGLTDSPDDVARYSLKSTVADLVGILDELNIDKVHCVGYSMGGRVAVNFASLHHERVASLILTSTSTGIESEEGRANRRESDRILADKILNEGVEEFVNFWEKIPLFASNERCLLQDAKTKLRKARLANNPKGLANSLLGMCVGSQPYLMDALERFVFPVLLINGEYDEKYVGIMCAMAKRIANCRIVTVSECGHAVHIENAEEFGEIIFSFINKEM